MTNLGRPLPEGTVTVLFTDVEGSTALASRLGDEATRRLLRPVEDTIRDQIDQHSGVDVKGIGDGVMGAFQSARRAVECAVAIQRELDRRPVRADTPVRVRIGINTGEVIHERADLFGNAVNAAKRIESVADPGGILISATTRALLGQTTDFILGERGPVDLKGFDEPWTLYEVEWRPRGAGLGTAPGELTPFIGREREYSRLVELVERAMAGTGGIAFIGGEAGIGKSRLTDEVCREARSRGVLTLVGHCQEEGRQPYLPFVETLERAVEIVSPEALRVALGPSAPEVAKLMPDLRARYDDIPDPVPIPPDQERRHLLNSIRDFLGRAASVQAMLLVFEDVQWADESTLLLIRRLAQRVAETRLCVVLTFRDVELDVRHPLTDVVQDLVRQRHAEEILLTTLPRSEVAGLLERVAGSAPPDHVTALVYSETEGNPFFVEELYRHLVDSGKLFEDDGGWNASLELADDEVPRGVRLLVERRMQGLSDECRDALTHAALIGRVFGYDVVGAVADLDDDALLNGIEEAERASIVREVSRGRETTYTFVHEQFRQTLLSLLSSPRRQRIHRKLGDVLEERYGDEAPRHADELAHHFYAAGGTADPDKTEKYLVLAAEHALSALAYEDAVWYLDAAGTAHPRAGSDVLARRLHLRALALRGLGRIDEAFAHLEHALELAGPNGDHDAILGSRAELYLGLFRGHEAVRDFLVLIENAKGRGDAASELQALLGLGSAYYVVSLNEPDRATSARDTLERAYDLGKKLGDKAAMARARLRTVYFTDFWPEYAPIAMANTQEALELAEQIGDEGLVLDAMVADIAFGRGGDREAEYELLRERLESRRDPLRLKEHYFHGMWGYRGVARFADAVAVCDAAIALADDLGVPPVMYPTLRALSLIDLGRYDEARDALDLEVTDEPFGFAFREFGRAHYLSALMAHAEAADLAREVAALMDRLGRYAFRVTALGVLARSLIALPSATDDELRSIVDELPGDAKAEVRLASGDAAGAFDRLERSIGRADDSGQRRAAIVAGEAKVRALLMLERKAEAVEEACRWLEQALAAEFRPMVWRLYLSRGQAGGPSEDFAAAASVVAELAATIGVESQREVFLSDAWVREVQR